MKSIWNKIALSGIALFMICSTVFVLQGCKDDDESNWVDLRYRVEDSYTVPHHATADQGLSVTFQVKSTDPWEIIGETGGDWYTVSPASGDDPEQTYDVTITCEENMSLDDRTETFDVKSDYWTGKTFTLTQQGIAFLEQNYDPSEGVGLIPMDGSTPVTFQVHTNQNWTAEVTSGAEWLTIVSGESGTGDATLAGENFDITISGEPNTGAMRYGVITIYDRNGNVAQEVQITQDGVQVEPAIPENGSFWQIYGEAQSLTIPVTANSVWRASKGNETDTWYDFEETEFDGSANLVINLQENGESPSTREGSIVLESVSDDPSIDPVTVTIRIKQASTEAARTTMHEINTTVSEGQDYYFTPNTGVAPGRYDFYVGPFGDSQIRFFFMWYPVVTSNGEYCQFTYYVEDRTTVLGTTPYSNKVNQWGGSSFPVDTDSDNVLSVDYAVTENETGSWLEPGYYLNGEFLISTISDGSNEWIVQSSAVENVGCSLLLRCVSGSVPFYRWAYVAPIEWGE